MDRATATDRGEVFVERQGHGATPRPRTIGTQLLDLIEMPSYNEGARRPALMTELADMAVPDDPEDCDLDLATDILLDREHQK